uniref:Uncharacterized protein n=1 Tax=Salix viminalis TaxID=40686 RepID=A0A6N2M0D6_SALVM
MQLKAAGNSLVSTFCSSGANSFTSTPLVEAHFVYGADILIVQVSVSICQDIQQNHCSLATSYTSYMIMGYLKSHETFRN